MRNCHTEDHTRRTMRKMFDIRSSEFNSSKKQCKKVTNAPKFGDEVDPDYSWLLNFLNENIEQSKPPMEDIIRDEDEDEDDNEDEDEDNDDENEDAKYKDPQYCMFLKQLTENGKSYKLKISKEDEAPCFLEYEQPYDPSTDMSITLCNTIMRDMQIDHKSKRSLNGKKRKILMKKEASSKIKTEPLNNLGVDSCYQLFLKGYIPSEYGAFVYEGKRVNYEEKVTNSNSDSDSDTDSDMMIWDKVRDLSEANKKQLAPTKKEPSLKLILQYLGGIPRPSEPILKYNRDDLKGLPFTFPTTITREVVRSPMVEAQCSVQLCFPVELKNEKMMEDVHFIGFLSKLLEAKIIQVLRFKHGQIYSAGVSVFLGGNKPSRVGNARGDISVNFSCDPDVALALVDLALDEILRLQEEGPSDADISTVLEIEQRAHENGLQENYWWLDRILHSYQSRIYSGDVGTSFAVQDESRIDVRKILTPVTAQQSLQKTLPFPCKKQYTVVILMPQASRFERLKSFITDAKVQVGFGGMVVLGFCIWRYARRSSES